MHSYVSLLQSLPKPSQHLDNSLFSPEKLFPLSHFKITFLFCFQIRTRLSVTPYSFPAFLLPCLSLYEITVRLNAAVYDLRVFRRSIVIYNLLIIPYRLQCVTSTSSKHELAIRNLHCQKAVTTCCVLETELWQKAVTTCCVLAPSGGR